MEPNRRRSRPNCMNRYPFSLLLVAILVAGAACTGTSPETPAGSASSDPDRAVSSTPGTSRTGEGGALRVTSKINLEDPKPIRWERYELLRGGTALDFYYWSGVEECYAFDHPEVLYGRKRITVTLFEGRVPDVDACIELAVKKVVEVALGEPLGDRKVVDGAKD